MRRRGRPGAPDVPNVKSAGGARGGSRTAPRQPSGPGRPMPASRPAQVLGPTPFSHPAAWTALGVTFACVLISVTYTLFETDVWQHLLVGKAIWQLRHVPTTQLWAWPSYGDPEVNSAWLFRALIWPLWSLGESWGLYAWRWVTTLIAFAALWAAARVMGARGFAALVVPVACVLVFRTRAQIRPETLVAVLMALEIWILETRRHGGRDRTAWLPAIALLWANAHLSWFLGLILIGIHWFAAILAARRRRPGEGGIDPRPNRLLVVALASLAVSFLNPFGWPGLWQPFEFALHWRGEPMFQGIGELQRLPLTALRSIGVSFLIILWPLLIVWRGVRRGWDLVEALVCLAFIPLALSSVRFLGYLSLVALPYLARDLDAWVSARRWPAWSAPPWRRAALAAIACVALGWPDWTAPGTGLGVGIDTRYIPARACDFMAAHGIRGRGFNHFHVGGYMLWRFWPERERLPFATIHPEALRPEDRLGYEKARMELAGWRALDERHRFDYALLYRRQFGGDRLLDALDADPDFALVFLDDIGAVYVRRDGPLAAVADRFAYRAAPGGRSALGALGLASDRDSTLRAVAIADLERQVVGSPYNAMSNSVLASLFMTGGRFGEAEGRLRAALAVDPDLPRAHERLGVIALTTGRPRDAVVELERALRERPIPPGLHFSLARAWQQMGDPAKARAHFRAESRIAGGHPGALEALRALDEGTVR